MMKRMVLTFLILLGNNMAYAQPVKKAALKPSPERGVRGATPLAGDIGQLGVTYTLPESPWNFTLKSAEFSVGRIVIGSNIYAPQADQKLLVLRYTVQNSSTDGHGVSYNTIHFTVVDPTNVNRDGIDDGGNAATHATVDQNLLPGQKVDVYTAVIIPAKGTVPKLLMNWGGSRIVRFFLADQLARLPAPFADPADASGATALAEVPAEAGKYYPLLNLDAQLVSTAWTTETLAGNECPEGKRFFVATLRVKNQSPAKLPCDYGRFKTRLLTSDGDRVEYNEFLLKTTGDEQVNRELDPGEEYTVRLFFAVPKEVDAKTLLFSEGDSRAYAFPVSETK
jgi:hypothetical protein